MNEKIMPQALEKLAGKHEVDPIIRTTGSGFLDGVSEVVGERFGRRARVSDWTGSGGGVRGSSTESTPSTLDDNRLPTCTP